MFKRLSISLLLMGLAAFGLGAAAFAWFSTSETGNVSISSGSADIAIDVDIDCTGGAPDDTIDGATFNFTWDDIVPGDVSEDCFTLENTGDGDLDLFVQHTDIGGQLANVLLFTYDGDLNPVDGGICGPALPGVDGFTIANDNRGCPLGTVLEDETMFFVVRVVFPHTNSDQNFYEERVLNMKSVITGYTSAP